MAEVERITRTERSDLAAISRELLVTRFGFEAEGSSSSKEAAR